MIRWRAWFWVPCLIILGMALLMLASPQSNNNLVFALLLLAVALGTFGLEKGSL